MINSIVDKGLCILIYKNKLKIMEKRLKNIQTFEQHSSELNISDITSGYVFYS